MLPITTEGRYITYNAKLNPKPEDVEEAELPGSIYRANKAEGDEGEHGKDKENKRRIEVDGPPLSKWRHNRLSVTDFSAQLWCERQLELALQTGRKKETEAMRLGTARHEKLEAEDHDVIEVSVQTNEDSLGIRLQNCYVLLNQLLDKGRLRELWVFGNIGDTVIRGVIDEMEIRKHVVTGRPEVVISDTKTRSQEQTPGPAQKMTSAMQLRMYRFMVQQLREGRADFERLMEVYKCDSDREFQAPELHPFQNLRDLCEAVKTVASRLPPLKDCVEVVYECNGHVFSRDIIEYDEQSTLYVANDLVKWWRGEREAEYVLISDKWKCQHCDFLDVCNVTPVTPITRNRILKKRKEEQERKEVEALLEGVDGFDADIEDLGQSQSSVSQSSSQPRSSPGILSQTSVQNAVRPKRRKPPISTPPTGASILSYFTPKSAPPKAPTASVLSRPAVNRRRSSDQWSLGTLESELESDVSQKGKRKDSSGSRKGVKVTVERQRRPSTSSIPSMKPKGGARNFHSTTSISGPSAFSS